MGSGDARRSWNSQPAQFDFTPIGEDLQKRRSVALKLFLAALAVVASRPAALLQHSPQRVQKHRPRLEDTPLSMPDLGQKTDFFVATPVFRRLAKLQ